MKNSIALNLFGFNKINNLGKNIRDVSQAFFGKILANFMQPQTKIQKKSNVEFNFKVRSLEEVLNSRTTKQKSSQNTPPVNITSEKLPELQFIPGNKNTQPENNVQLNQLKLTENKTKSDNHIKLNTQEETHPFSPLLDRLLPPKTEQISLESRIGKSSEKTALYKQFDDFLVKLSALETSSKKGIDSHSNEIDKEIAPFFFSLAQLVNKLPKLAQDYRIPKSISLEDKRYGDVKINLKLNSEIIELELQTSDKAKHNLLKEHLPALNKIVAQFTPDNASSSPVSLLPRLVVNSDLAKNPEQNAAVPQDLKDGSNPLRIKSIDLVPKNYQARIIVHEVRSTGIDASIKNINSKVSAKTTVNQANKNEQAGHSAQLNNQVDRAASNRTHGVAQQDNIIRENTDTADRQAKAIVDELPISKRISRFLKKIVFANRTHQQTEHQVQKNSPSISAEHVEKMTNPVQKNGFQQNLDSYSGSKILLNTKKSAEPIPLSSNTDKANPIQNSRLLQTKSERIIPFNQESQKAASKSDKDNSRTNLRSRYARKTGLVASQKNKVTEAEPNQNKPKVETNIKPVLDNLDNRSMRADKYQSKYDRISFNKADTATNPINSDSKVARPETAFENTIKPVESPESQKTMPMFKAMESLESHRRMDTSIKMETNTQIINRIQDFIEINQFKPGSGIFKSQLKVQSEIMGRMEIQYDEREKSKNIRVVVESEAARTEMQKLVPMIAEQLNQKGIDLESFRVDVNQFKEDESLEKDKNNKEQKHQSQKAEEAKNEKTDAAVASRNYGYNTIEVLA